MGVDVCNQAVVTEQTPRHEDKSLGRKADPRRGKDLSKCLGGAHKNQQSKSQGILGTENSND